MAAPFAALFPLCSIGLAFQALSVGPLKPAPDGAPRIEGAAPEPNAIRIESALVEIPVHVTNSFGATVTGLSKADFQLWDDNTPQEITHFSMDDAPASVGLVYDTSGSMRDKIGQSAAAAGAFFHTANPEDEFFLIEFGDWPKLVTSFTPQGDQILTRILRMKPFGRTALLDAVHMAVKEMRKASKPRKAILVLSDGGDNESRHSLREVEKTLVESDVQLYAMGVYGHNAGRKLPAEERNGPRLLADISESTGGRLYKVTSADELPSISARISKELRTQYVLGYRPPALACDGKYHRITVKVSNPELHVYARRGYVAPQ